MWDVQGASAGNGQATFRVNGNDYFVPAGEVLRDVVIRLAREAGYGKFRFYVNDEEVAPQDAPELVQAGVVYKVVPYDAAG